MKSVCKLLRLELNEISTHTQYEYVKDKCSYYNKVWDINIELLDASRIYEDLFTFNTSSSWT